MPKKKPEKSLDELLEGALVKEGEQPYKAPGNWVWVKIGNVIEEVEKKDPKKEGVDKFTYLDISSINNITGKIANPKICQGYKAPSRARQVVKANDILFSTVRHYLKNIAVVDEIYNDQIASTGFCVLRSDGIIDSNLLFQFVRSDIFVDRLNGFQRGISYPAVKTSDLLKQPVLLPPVPEQKRIVKKLSSMLGKLKEARELIKEARNTFEERRAAILNKAFTGELTKKWRKENPDVELELSMIQEIEKKPFDIPSSWKWARLQDVCSRFQYGTSAKSSKEGKVPVVRMGNIQNGIISWENLVYTLNDKEIDQYNLNYNDVLFNRTNSPALVGKTAIYKGEMPAIYAGYLIRVKPQDKLNADFLNFFLNSPYARYKCNRVKTDGVSQSNINSKKLRNFEVPLPPLEEQQEIVRILEKLLDHENEARALIDMEEKIDLLEKSILPKAFRGELDTNDTNDEPAIELLKKSLKEKMNK